MEDFQSPTIRSYRSYEGNRNLQLVDPADLKQVRGIYVVRESKRTRSTITPDLWHKVPHKDLPVRPRKTSSRSLVKGWWSNPEMKRKRRVAKYKVYSAEGKMRSSLKKSYKWFKVQCSKIIHGY